MSANKVRVPVRGSVGKSVRFSADSGASGATIGVDFRLPDGSIPTLQQLAAALVTGDALSDQPGNIIPPGGGPAVIWQNIQYVPRNVLYPARPVQAEEEAGEEYYRMAVPGPAGVRGLQGFSGPLAEEPEDHISIPGAAGVAGSAGPPGAISAVHLWPDDPEDHISIPGVAGPQGASGNPGTQGPISTVHLYPDDPEDPMTVPGAAGPTGTSGAQGAPGIISAVHLWPDDPEDPMTVPGAPGTAGAAGAQGAPGIISAVHLWPDDPEDHISIPGAAGLQGTTGATGAQGPPGLVSAVHLWPDDPEDPLSGIAISFAPPATLVGLTAIPGGAPNAMRSDAAPALSQAIVPIWTGAHTFNNSFRATAATAASVAVSGIDIDVQAANAPRIRWTSSASAADAKYWELISNSSGTMILRAMNDAYAVASIALSIVRTGAALTSVTFGNATDNPTYSFSGTGLTTHTGDVTVGAAARTGGVTLTASNTSVVDGDFARAVIASGSSNVALYMTDAAQSTAIVTGGPTGLQAVLRVLGAGPIVFGTSNTYAGKIDANGIWTLVANAAGTHAVNSLNGASDTLALNAPSGRFTTLLFNNAGALKAQIAWDNTNSRFIFGVPSVGITLDSSGLLYKQQPAPSAVNATATLTIAQLLTRIITSTTALAVTGTLPTGTLSDAGLMNGAGSVNDSFDWVVINTGALIFTVAAGVGHTLVGAGAVAAATSALFRTVKTAANTFITYRAAV